MHARCVEKTDLCLGLGNTSRKAIAGGLRFVSTDRGFLPDQPIHKRGLPSIRPPHNGHKPGSKILFFRAVFLFSHQGFTIGRSSALGCSASCSNVIFAVLASFPVSAATTPPLL